MDTQLEKNVLELLDKHKPEAPESVEKGAKFQIAWFARRLMLMAKHSGRFEDLKMSDYTIARVEQIWRDGALSGMSTPEQHEVLAIGLALMVVPSVTAKVSITNYLSDAEFEEDVAACFREVHAANNKKENESCTPSKEDGTGSGAAGSSDVKSSAGCDAKPTSTIPSGLQRCASCKEDCPVAPLAKMLISSWPPETPPRFSGLFSVDFQP